MPGGQIMEKVWEIKDPDQYLHPQKKKRITRELPPSKNPARAYTLSLFFWGGGQSYNEQRGKGLLFQLSLIIFCLGIALSLIYWKPLLEFLHSHGLSNADTFLGTEVLFFFILIFWMYNAGDAYHMAAKTGRKPFRGVHSRVYPFLCSLLIPGWGQFLNGQPIKGSIFSGFSILGLFSLVSIPSVFVAWPFLEISETRFVVEEILLLTVLFAPLIPFIWLFGSYDALKVSLDDLKKEPFFERIKSANNRRRTQGWVRGVFPQIKSTVVLGLVLIFLLIAAYHYVPALLNYYQDQLSDIQAGMQKQGMTILPELINKLLSLMASGKYL